MKSNHLGAMTSGSFCNGPGGGEPSAGSSHMLVCPTAGVDALTPGTTVRWEVASGMGDGEAWAAPETKRIGACTPLGSPRYWFQAIVASTRGSALAVTASPPPHDWPITTIRVSSSRL